METTLTDLNTFQEMDKVMVLRAKYNFCVGKSKNWYLRYKMEIAKYHQNLSWSWPMYDVLTPVLNRYLRRLEKVVDNRELVVLGTTLCRKGVDYEAMNIVSLLSYIVAFYVPLPYGFSQDKLVSNVKEDYGGAEITEYLAVLVEGKLILTKNYEKFLVLRRLKSLIKAIGEIENGNS